MKSILLLFFAFSRLCACTQTTEEKIARLDSIFSGLHASNEWNGNVLVAEKGSVIYQKSFGYADWNSGALLDSESIFELASVSKQFTAMGILILAHEGKLSLDDSLRKFFPQMPYSGVNIRHLLQHTAGLPDYMELFARVWDSTRIATNDDIIAVFAEQKPSAVFAPGEKFEYSNTGYALLASIIAKVSGKSFADFLSEKIFKPLGMDRTLVYSRRKEGRKIENYAFGYNYDPATKKYTLPDEDPRSAAIVYYLDGIQGDGCVNATTGDLFKWHEALKTSRLVPLSMIGEAFTPGTVAGVSTGYGYGWGLGISKTYGRIQNHSGGWYGYSTYIERLPDEDRLIVLLQNTGRKLPPIARIRMALYDIPDLPVVEEPVSASEMTQYTGVYELSPQFRITVSVKEGKLLVQATNQEAFEIFRERDDLFFLKVVEAKIQFTRDAGGQVTGLILLQNGNEVPGRKL